MVSWLPHDPTLPEVLSIPIAAPELEVMSALARCEASYQANMPGNAPPVPSLSPLRTAEQRPHPACYPA
jgi:hypothetical protein